MDVGARGWGGGGEWLSSLPAMSVVGKMGKRVGLCCVEVGGRCWDG